MKPNNNSTTKYKALKDKLPKRPADEYDRKVVSYLKKKYNEQSELDEAVTVKKEKHSWGKMVTVHHGSETSYPLHPEHQAAIKKLRPGMKTTFKDETNSTVHASREGDMVHLHRPKTSNKLTSVAYSHFDEQVELGFKNFKNNIIEKTLTPAEMKKREEVAKAIEREKPNMPMGMKMAIATKTAKRVAESQDSEPVTELSSELLGRYKKAAGASASAADAEGDMATGNKRFSGIMKATKKQFNNDMKTEETDDEGKMAKGQLMRMVNQASALAQMMEDDKQLDGWVQSKLTMASDYLDSVHDYLMHNKQDVDEMEEETVVEAYTEDDIAKGGTVIYKQDGKHYMAKVSHKTGGGAATKIHTTSKLGHVVSLNHVVSTDSSDWNRFKNIKEETVVETKGAPKGFHFTKDGKLKRGDASQDGDGGPMLRSDPLDKQRNKIPAVSEAPEGEHLCAKHVYSNMFGEGVVVDSLHAEPDEEGNIEWYAVQFEEGIKKVFTEKLQVMTASYHGNHKKKRMTNGR